MEQKVQSQSSETVPVAWQHNKGLGACMIELYDKSLWTDVNFHCKDHEDGARIHAHKVVLAARSPVFQAMFFGPCADGKDEVELDNSEAKILDLLLRYMYSDAVSLKEETATSVLEMAHYYQVTNLVQFCADYLATILTNENACGILTLAMFYHIKSLRDDCCSYIDKNADEILKSEGFLELSEECLRYLLKGDTFFAEEKEIFIKAEEWAARKLKQDNLEKNGPNIRRVLGETFYHLRLPTMTYETLMECTRRKGYLSTDEYEDIVDFINKITGSSVKINSYVPRLPTEETLTSERIRFYFKGFSLNTCTTETTDSIATSFHISVSRDVKLSYIGLAKIQQYLKYNEKHYKKKSNVDTHISVPEQQYFSRNSLFGYAAPFIPETKPLNSITDRLIKETLVEVHGETLIDTFDAVLSGCLTVTCDEKEENDKEEEEEKEEEEDHGGVVVRKDDDSTCNLILKQDFAVSSSQVSEEIIKLKDPVTLTEAASPYTVKLTIHYSCDSNVKMKAECSNRRDTITSEYGQLQVENIAGNFAGIRCLGFENISNRDTVLEADTTI